MSLKTIVSMIGGNIPDIPLTTATLTSQVTTVIEGNYLNLNVSWAGGTGPYTVEVITDYYGPNNPQATQSNITGNSTTISVIAKQNVAWYTARVRDSLGTFVSSNEINVITLWIRAPSVSGYFITSSKIAYFSASAQGYPSVNYSWYVSVNGGSYYLHTTAPNWYSGEYSPSTTISAYCVVSNSAGSASSGTVYVPYG